MKILFHNAKILTMISPKVIDGDLLVIDTRIAYIGPDASSFSPFDRIIECNKNLLMPGFKNAHAHSAMIFLRGKAEGASLQEWLFDVVFPREAKLKEDDIYHLNKVAYLEYVANGITACYEHYFYPLSSAKAAHDFGFRTLLLGTYDEEKTSVDDLVKIYHYINDNIDDLVTYSIGFHAEYTSDEKMVKETKKALDILKAPFYTHLAETKKEVDGCYVRHNMSPVQYLAKEGLFDYGGGGYHCIWLDEKDIAIFKKYHLYVVSCPGSNLKINSGIAPLNKYLAEGINIALGTDGPASNDSLDMFREMNLVANNNRQSISSFDILKMATVNGAKAMNMLDADVLEVNKLADIIMIDLTMPNVSHQTSIINNLVYNAKKENVVLTMINGKILYEKGQYFLKESPNDIYKKANEVMERLESDLVK